MTPDELKAAWAANITSYEQFNGVLARTRDQIPRTAMGSNYANHLPQVDHAHVGRLVHGNDHAWPLWRDMIREAIGMYPEPTSVLKWLRSINSNTGAGQMFPHVSPIDKMEIAFSPDATQAKADRKQRMSVGRFLRKFLLFVPDSEIQRLDQQHRAELDTTFELAQTVEAIREVYEDMAGDTGCMRYGRDHFGHEEFHPSAVYASPGMGVAYTADEHGTIKSRSVVWVNPQDANDKRYVRVYGDVILKKKLEMNGYRMAGLAGAKLRIYEDPSFRTSAMVVMPWIDPAGGIHERNVDRALDSEHALRFEGDEFITLIDGPTRARYEKAGIYPVNVQTQNGHVEVPLVDTTKFIFTCPLSGRSVNRMDEATQLWIDENGAILRAASSAIDAHQGSLSSLQIQHEGRLQRAYCTQEVRDKFGIPGHVQYFNNEATRDAIGVCMLDKTFYPESERWFARASCVFIEDATGARTYIKKDDAVMLYAESGNKFIHIEMVRPMKREGCVPVSPFNNFRGIAHKDHKFLATTRSGKRVITSVHDVSSLYDGTWEYTRNVKQVSIAGLTLSLHKDDDAATVQVSDEFVRRQYESVFKLWYRTSNQDDNERRWTNRMVSLLGNGFNGSTAFMRKGEAVVAIDYYNKPVKVQEILEAAQGILLMKDDTEWMRRTLGYHWPKAVPWARAVVQVMASWQAYKREHEMMLAEANAVEAAPSTQAVIEKLNTLADADMDKLIAEVDDTLATAVVRRWPRLQAAGMMQPQQSGHELSPNVARALDQMEAVMGNDTRRSSDGMTMQQVSDALDREADEYNARSPDGMGPQRIDLPTTVDENGAMVPVPVPVAAPNFVLQGEPTAIGTLSSAASAQEQARQIAVDTFGPQAIADDDLLGQLQAVGLAPIVIDETTVFPEINRNPETGEIV